jgi:hypothetical protein
MTFAALEAELDARGVKITAVEGKLRIEAPAGAVTDALRAALAEHKAALLCRYAVNAVSAVKCESVPLQRANVTMEPWQVALWADYPRMD